ncbi:mitochondrial tRNA-specific 2-thiouridylase 1 [Schistocerca nitens]|uniref:mitochondrial tRNA-specific 2-thiouridylase 1 n=1 Tax=Schistocerca nitens TaxID=7011 RepID=UPI00211806A6|nr:mitochondrial tRNA-specific 2-thiouridylase 1 [Schistocerca nitens]
MLIRKVALAVSGGVDSAVAGIYLKSKGYDVHGVFMKNWDVIDETGACTSQKDEEDAEWVCNKLQIPFHRVNFVKEYWIDVFSNLVKDYESGYTPNPDILCNKHIKFDKFFKYAVETLGCDAVATGHYARTSFGEYLEDYKPSKGVHLLIPVDRFKDQTFFLSQVKQESLQRTLFPLSNLTKDRTKLIACEAGFDIIANKRESTGICFIGTRNFQRFISEYVRDKQGAFVDIDTGHIVGEHKGIHHWTLGQRCRFGGLKKPYFIAQKDVERNIIYVVAGTDHPCLYSKFMLASGMNWIHSVPKSLRKNGVLNCMFRFQHTKPLTPCKVSFINKNDVVIELAESLRALTPGQYAVFYTNQECLGSARIHNVACSLRALKNLKC